jgi:hypothetical protein
LHLSKLLTAQTGFTFVFPNDLIQDSAAVFRRAGIDTGDNFQGFAKESLQALPKSTRIAPSEELKRFYGIDTHDWMSLAADPGATANEEEQEDEAEEEEEDKEEEAAAEKSAEAASSRRRSGRRSRRVRSKIESSDDADDLTSGTMLSKKRRKGN